MARLRQEMSKMSSDNAKATNYANEAYQFFESEAFRNYKAYMDQQQENEASQPQFHYKLASTN